MKDLDAEMPLVGRGVVVDLVEELIARDHRRPNPVVVVYGPGGSGKSAVIAHLERYFNENTLLARVKLEQDKSKRTEDVLDALAAGLCQDSHANSRKLTLPRYEVARIIRDCAAETATDPNAHKLIRRRLSERMSPLFSVGEAVRQGGEVGSGVGGFLGRLFRPVAQWMYSAAVVAPQPLRRLLVSPKFAEALRWYETPASWRPNGTPTGVGVDNVGAEFHRRMNEDPGGDGFREELHRIMVAALLADLRSQFRSRRSHKLNCLVLLDDADLLAPDDAQLWAVRGAPPARPRGTDLLDLLATEMREHPRTPLLTVATKQAAPATDGFGAEDLEIAVPEDETSGADRARAEAHQRYRVWRARPRDSTRRRREYLPVSLDGLTLENTHQLLDELSAIGEHTVREDIGVQEIFNATHGHPLAVHLVAKKLSRLNNSPAPPSVRETFDRRAAPDVDTDGREDVRTHMLTRFLQRFRSDAPVGHPAAVGAHADDSEDTSGAHEPEIRRETTELLARLAAPMSLDEATVDLLTSDQDPDDRERIKEHLPNLSFVTTRADGTWTLHPLLRDLLVTELTDGPTAPGFSYVEIHRKLAEHYRRSGEHGRGASTNGTELARQYHLLALDDYQAVAGYFADRATRGDSDGRWLDDLYRISRAPTTGTPDARWWSRRRGSSESGQGPVLSLVKRVSALRSGTGRRRWTKPALDNVDRSLRDVAHGAARTREWPRAQLGSAPPVAPNLRADQPYPYPRSLITARRLRKLVSTTLVVALVGYGLAFGAHAYQHCLRGFRPLAPVRAVWDDTLMLDRSGDGQCLGLAVGVGDFSSKSVHRDGELEADAREIRELAELIHEENRRVRRRRRPELPHVTVVVSTILSTNQLEPRHGLSVGVNELRGAYLAQRSWNGFGDHAEPPPFYVRIVLANLGGQSEEAEQVDDKIRDLVRQDPTVLGVTGLGQTRPSVIEAVDSLGPDGGSQGGIPMVASALSGGAFTGERYFFRVAVTNERQAKVGARYLAGLQHAEDRKPFILADSTDPYSKELAKHYDTELSGHDAFAADPVRLEYRTAEPALSPRTRERLRTNMRDMCRASNRAGRDPLLVYTGRANELSNVLKALGSTSCFGRTLVFGGDDLAQIDMSSSSYLLDRGVENGQLRFTSFGVPQDEWREVSTSAQVGRAMSDYFRLYERARETTDPSVFRGASNGHIVAAYDALGLLLAAGRAGGVGTGGVVDREAVNQALLGMTYPGATGVIQFPQRAPDGAFGDPVRKLVTIHSVVGMRSARNPEPELVAAFGHGDNRP